MKFQVGILCAAALAAVSVNASSTNSNKIDDIVYTNTKENAREHGSKDLADARKNGRRVILPAPKVGTYATLKAMPYWSAKVIPVNTTVKIVPGSDYWTDDRLKENHMCKVMWEDHKPVKTTVVPMRCITPFIKGGHAVLNTATTSGNINAGTVVRIESYEHDSNGAAYMYQPGWKYEKCGIWGDIKGIANRDEVTFLKKKRKVKVEVLKSKDGKVTKHIVKLSDKDWVRNFRHVPVGLFVVAEPGKEEYTYVPEHHLTPCERPSYPGEWDSVNSSDESRDWRINIDVGSKVRVIEDTEWKDKYGTVVNSRGGYCCVKIKDKQKKEIPERNLEVVTIQKIARMKERDKKMAAIRGLLDNVEELDKEWRGLLKTMANAKLEKGELAKLVAETDILIKGVYYNLPKDRVVTIILIKDDYVYFKHDKKVMKLKKEKLIATDWVTEKYLAQSYEDTESESKSNSSAPGIENWQSPLSDEPLVGRRRRRRLSEFFPYNKDLQNLVKDLGLQD